MLTEAVLVNEAALPVTTVLMLNASIGEHPNQRTKEEEHEGKAKQRKKTTLKSGFQLPGSFILMVSSHTATSRPVKGNSLFTIKATVLKFPQ